MALNSLDSGTPLAGAIAVGLTAKNIDIFITIFILDIKIYLLSSVQNIHIKVLNYLSRVLFYQMIRQIFNPDIHNPIMFHK